MILELFSKNTSLDRESRLCTSPKVDRRNTVYQLTNVPHREGFLYRPSLRARWLDGSRPAATRWYCSSFSCKEKERKNEHFAAKNCMSIQFLLPKTAHSRNFCCPKSHVHAISGIETRYKKYGSPFTYHPAQDQVKA